VPAFGVDDVGRVAEHIDTRETGHGEIGRHVDTAALSLRQARGREHGSHRQPTRPHHDPAGDLAAVGQDDSVPAHLRHPDTELELHTDFGEPFLGVGLRLPGEGSQHCRHHVDQIHRTGPGEFGGEIPRYDVLEAFRDGTRRFHSRRAAAADDDVEA